MPRRNASGYAGISVTDLWKRKGAKVGNRWYVRIAYRDGRRESTTCADKPDLTKRGVAEWANQERARVEDGVAVLPSADLRRIGAAYATNLRARGRSESYVKHIERVVQALAKRGITDPKDAISFRTRVEEWLGGLKANWWAPKEFKFKRQKVLALSGSLKNRILRELRSLLNNAVELRAIGFNPLDGVKPYETVEKAREIPSVSEAASLVSERFAADPWHLPLSLLLYTGCRVDEAMHLEWRDIDLKAGLIHVRHKAGVYSLKRKRERALPLQPELRDILDRHFKTTGFIIEDEYLRSNGSDIHLRGKREPRKRAKPVHADYSPAFRRYLTRCWIDNAEGELSKKDKASLVARIDALSPHSMRHWYISAMLASGAQWDDVMQWAGHSKASTTLRYRAMKQLIAKDVAPWPAGEFYLRRELSSAAPNATAPVAMPGH